MAQTTMLHTGHEDLIHDVSYDFYGKRLATCSSDQRIKVFDLNEDSGEWQENDSWKAHDANILKVRWAHPEHGQVIASCGLDRSVRIFEEQEQEPRSSGRRWAEKARLVDSTGGIHDIWFAPIHMGLKLASIASDATVRIYEAMLPQNMAHWTLIDDFSTLTSAPGRETESAFCLTWCPSRHGPPQLAVGAMDTVRLYRTETNRKWKAAEVLEGHKGLVRDVSWAPSAGRSYHLIATASKDGHVRIFKLTETKSHFSRKDSALDIVGEQYQGQEESRAKGIVVDCIADFDDHHGEVWRVSWNVTGTILSSAGDDGKVRLWKSAYSGKFQCMSVISAERPRDEDAVED